MPDLESIIIESMEKAAVPEVADKPDTPPVPPAEVLPPDVAPESKDALPEGAESTKEAETDEEQEAKTPAPPAEITDDMKVKVGDDEVKVADLKAGFMRLGDYRQKTAEVAREREAVKAERGTWDEERGQMRGYLTKLFNDPEFLAEELENYGPQTLDKILNNRADELIRRETMSDQQKRDWDEIQREKREIKRQKRLQDQETHKRQMTEGKSKADAVKIRYTKVVPEALKSAGLAIDGDIEHNKAMVRQMQAELVLIHGNEAEYTDEQIREAAAAVAEHPAVRALMREKRGMSQGVEELVKTLGPDKLRELLKHEATKSAAARPASTPTIKTGQTRGTKEKKPISIPDFFSGLRDKYEQ